MSILDNLRRMMLMQSGSTNRERGIMNRQNTGGLINNNQPQQFDGLFGNLANINPNLLIGASIAGSGLRGIDPFSSVLPALTETAQLQKYLTPEKEKLMTAYDPETKKTVFATRTQIEEKGLTPVPESPETTAAQKNFAALKKIEETGTELEKRVARMVYGKQGREPMSKTEFLSKVTTNLSKDALAEPEDIQKILPKWEKVYDDIFKIETQSMNENILEIPETKDELIDGQQYSIDGQILIWNKKKDQFE
jgi:hypothetical protein